MIPVIAMLAIAPPQLDQLKADDERWHQKRIERLKAEDGWLSLVGLHWLDEGRAVAGSADDAEVKLPPSAPARLGIFTRKGKEVSFTPEKGVAVTVDGKPFAGGPVKTDATEKPDTLRVGTLQMLPIVRGERVGVRVRDSASAVRRSFEGIDRYPVRTEWWKEARFEPGGDRKITVPNVLGEPSEEPLAGTAVFTHGGKEHRLDAVWEDGKLFFIFGDQTNGKETYGSGRFLYADAPKDGRVVLDFNRAYNPPCVFTPYATCPLPPKQNKLPVRVEAGELRFKGH
jgi:uncharacterized protein